MRALLIACAILAASQASAEIVIYVTDPPSSGFNDPTPVAPVGGNPGVTLGEQRLNVFLLAADLWDIIALSNQEIVVRASFGALMCNSSSAVLGLAGPISIESDFPGAPIANTWYVAPLANAVADNDLDPNNFDIQASFNGNIDDNNACLNGINWYYGLDNEPPGQDMDLFNVIMHELAHGMGFFSAVDVETGSLPSNRPDIYSRFVLNNETLLHLSEMNDSERVAAITSGNKLVWDGPVTTARAAELLAPEFFGTDPNGFVRLYAPSTVAPGSSLSHFDTSVTPNALMEPSINSSLNARLSIDLTPNVFADIGWYVADFDGDLVTDIQDNCVLNPNPNQLDGDDDLYGNACDADLNGDGIVNVLDLGLLRLSFFSSDPGADFNGDGVVNVVDLGFLKQSFFEAPGPSGLHFDP